MNITALQLFLSQVRQIREQFRKISVLTGEEFNIFKILNVETSEVRLHSNFIAELLNPKGVHAQNDLYLKLFLEQLDICEIDSASSLVEVEKHIGLINTEYTEGGRIDIAITDRKGNQIFVENKIYAKDQKNQLLRYYNANNNARLFYLTLQGDQPTTNGTGEGFPPDVIKCISYEKDILKWLELCRKESVNVPVVRETLTQYIHLIKFLTNQSEIEAMNTEIRQFLLANPELIDSVEDCSKEIQAIFNEMSNEFVQLMNKNFPANEVVNTDGYTIKAAWGEDGDGVHFGYQAWQDDKNVSNSPELENYRSLLKATDSEFHIGGYWLGWLNPKPFKRYQRFRNLSAKQIVEFYGNRETLKNIVNVIVGQEAGIRSKFLSGVATDTIKS